eukprot:425372-Rhodomonas_salina.2
MLALTLPSNSINPGRPYATSVPGVAWHVRRTVVRHALSVPDIALQVPTPIALCVPDIAEHQRRRYRAQLISVSTGHDIGDTELSVCQYRTYGRAIYHRSVTVPDRIGGYRAERMSVPDIS